MKKFAIRSFSFFLLLAVLIVSLTSCGQIDFGLREAIESRDQGSHNTDEGYEEGVEDLAFFDYEIDTEDFVCELVASDLSIYYDVFPARVTLLSGEKVYGLGFTDYSEAYELEDGSRTLFSAGFISYCGEPAISENDRESVLEIVRLNEDVEGYGFIYTWEREAYRAHCVVFNNYVVYGVDEAGEIVYTEQAYDPDYLRKNFDESLGTLYSYDEDRILCDVDFGNFIPLSGIALSYELDFSELEAEINRIIAEQDYNFMQVDVETYVYLAQEALNSYLLSLQEETFMGCRVDDLVEISKQIDPMDYIRITPDGFEVLSVSPTPPPGPTKLTKWLTGIGVGIACVIGVVLSMYGQPHLGGAIIGGAVEIFMEVVIQNKNLKDIDFRKVAIAAVAGGISANLGLFGDSLVGGATDAVFTLIDGGNINDAAHSMVEGAAYGFALGAAFKIVGKGLRKIIDAVRPPKVQALPDVRVENAIFDGNYANKVDDPLSDAVEYQAKKQAKEAAEKMVKKPIGYNSNGVPKYTSDVLEDVSDEFARSEHVLNGNPTKTGTGFTGRHGPGRHTDVEIYSGKKETLSNGVVAITPIDGNKVDIGYDGMTKRVKQQTFFPDSWSDNKVKKATNLVAQKNIEVSAENGCRTVRGVVDDVEIEVVLDSQNEIITAYPTLNVD